MTDDSEYQPHKRPPVATPFGDIVAKMLLERHRAVLTQITLVAITARFMLTSLSAVSLVLTLQYISSRLLPLIPAAFLVLQVLICFTWSLSERYARHSLIDMERTMADESATPYRDVFIRASVSSFRSPFTLAATAMRTEPLIWMFVVVGMGFLTTGAGSLLL